MKWEGIVIEIKDKIFIAKLFDKKGNEKIAEIYIDKLDFDEKKFLKIGACFYLYVSKNKSVIIFRRLSKWSKEELELTKKEVQRFKNIMNWE